MRRAARVDSNHGEVVGELRRIGASVQPLTAVGDGCPDLLVGYLGLNVLMEVKDGDKPRSAQRLNEQQALWHAYWRGPVVVVRSAEEAVMMLRVLVQETWERERVGAKPLPLRRPCPSDCDEVTHGHL